MSTGLVEHDGLLYPCRDGRDGRVECGYCQLADIRPCAGAECPMCGSELVSVMPEPPRRALRLLDLFPKRR